MVSLACTIYGIKQGQDTGSLAWSFYVIVTSSVIMVINSAILGLEVHQVSAKSPDDRPILKHSCSVDSFTLKSPASSLEIQMQPARERAGSEVRMRVNSMSSLMPPSPIVADNSSEPSSVMSYDLGPTSP